MDKLPKLTPRQMAYALARISGKNSTDSFKSARPDNRLSQHALAQEAYKLEKHPKVKLHIEAGWREHREEVLLTRDKKRQILGSIALDRRAADMARIAAVKVDNDMTGDTKIRFEGEVTLFAIYQGLAAKSALPTPEELKAVKGTDKTVDALPAPDPAMQLTTAMDAVAPKKEKAG